MSRSVDLSVFQTRVTYISVCQFSGGRSLTHVAADLASPGWYAADFARVGYNKTASGARTAKPLNFLLGCQNYGEIRRICNDWFP
jgi:hypothetical protein